MIIDHERCIKCNACIEACPLEAIFYEDGILKISSDCANCRGCTSASICNEDAIQRSDVPPEKDAVLCPSCPVRCEIKPKKTGACQRFTNIDGTITRKIPVTTYEEVEGFVKDEYEPVLKKPLLVGIGAGTTTLNPPAPYIVMDKIDGVDVVTCVTECPFTFSGMKVKIDTEKHTGEEGADVLHMGKKVGMVTTEEYGSKILSLGGVRTFTAKDGWVAAKVISDIANRKRVPLTIKGGSNLEILVGEKPIIDGRRDERRRYGCGGAVCVMMIEEFREAADEVIVIDTHLTGKFRDLVGEEPWAIDTKSPIRLRFQTPVGWYFPHQRGKGWGGTNMMDPWEMIENIDYDNLNPGFTILFTEPNGDRCALYEYTGEKKFEEIPMTPKAMKAIEALRENCEPAKVSALYIAGAGGSARTSITRKPLLLTKAVKAKKARLTIGGAPAFILPGGGIDFIVDVEKVKPGSFSWLNIPATVAPLEYTMRLEDYLAIGGIEEAIRPLRKILKREGRKICLLT